MEDTMKYYPGLDPEKLKNTIKDVFAENEVKNKRKFVLYTWDKDFVEKFHLAMKEEVKKM